MSDDKVGYKKPPKNRQFGQPGGNPSGATSKQRRREIKNAELATAIRGKMLDAVMSRVGDEDEAFEMVEAAMLKLLVDSENRGLGAPKQTVETDVNIKQSTVDMTKLSPDALKEIIAAQNEPD